jgi:tetratricopeptide (TPR) repeat protein
MVLAIALVLAFAIGTIARNQTTREPTARNPRPAVTTDAAIESLQIRLTKNPGDTQAAVELGAAYLQKVRETGDPSWYARSEAVLQDVLRREPNNAAAMAWLGALQLSLHNFQAGLDWGLKAHATDPDLLAAYPVMIDGYVELGQYERAVALADEYVALRPDLPSYTRVAYLRELHGDRDGAARAMISALDTVAPGTEAGAWTRVQLGNLYLGGGDLAAAEREYLVTLQATPDYAPALAGLGKIAGARGDYKRAIDYLTQAAARIPLPEYVIPLGEVYLAAGDQEAAEQQFALVRVEITLLAANGQNTDLELALFEADHPAAVQTPQQVVAIARAALAARPSIYGHDALAWALFRAGEYDAAEREIELALALGTRDAMLHYHAGMIAKALGQTRAARGHLELALRINPHFSVLHAPEARAALDELGHR